MGGEEKVEKKEDFFWTKADVFLVLDRGKILGRKRKKSLLTERFLW